MSVVAIKVTPTGIEIAADSIAVRWITQQTKFVKLIQGDAVTIGGAGSAREIELMRLYAGNHKPAAATVEGILDFFGEFEGYCRDRIKNDLYKVENLWLLAFGGKAFHFESWGVYEVMDYEAIGAGMDYALTALHLGKTAVEAVEVACDLSIYCERPVVAYKL